MEIHIDFHTSHLIMSSHALIFSQTLTWIWIDSAISTNYTTTTEDEKRILSPRNVRLEESGLAQWLAFRLPGRLHDCTWAEFQMISALVLPWMFRFSLFTTIWRVCDGNLLIVFIYRCNLPIKFLDDVVNIDSVDAAELLRPSLKFCLTPSTIIASVPADVSLRVRFPGTFVSVGPFAQVAALSTGRDLFINNRKKKVITRSRSYEIQICQN